MLGEKVTMNQAMLVTLFSMGIVFATLLAISYILDAFKILFYKQGEKQTNLVKKETLKNKSVNKEEAVSNNKDEDDEELVAVITAAIASSLSKPIQNIKIRNIRRIPQNATTWSKVGRQELMR